MLFRQWRRNDGFIYFILIYPIKWFMHVFYRKIHYHDFKKVPADKPVLLALNHPTAFMDPLFMCAFLNGPIYNMTRGDIFRQPFFRKMLESCNMFPVYRSKDGYTNRDKNDATFEFCLKKLSKNHQIVIFVEGEHHKDWRIRTLQKGIARLSGFVFDKGVDDLVVIPVGLSFLHGDVFRDEVFVNIGEALPLKNYLAEDGLVTPKVQVRLLADIHENLKKLSFHLEHEEDLLASRVLMLFRNANPEPILPVFQNSKKRFDQQKAILEKMNAMPAETLEKMKTEVFNYFQTLNREKLPDYAICQPRWGKISWLFFFVLGFLPAVWGWLTSRPVALASKMLTRKFVKKSEFKSSVMFGSALILGIVFYLFLFLISWFSGNAFWVGMAASLPLTAWFSIVYREIFLRWKMRRRAKAHPDFEKIQNLRSAASKGANV